MNLNLERWASMSGDRTIFDIKGTVFKKRG